jgi:hypothetical protein
MSKFRVQEYGVCSYWPASLDQAMAMADQIMQRNGCGNIQVRQKDGTWMLTHRFENHAGVVEAIDAALKQETSND